MVNQSKSKPKHHNHAHPRARATGFRRITYACVNSYFGFKTAWEEEAFKSEILVFFACVPLSFYISTNYMQQIGLIAVSGLVILTELLNTAIERTIDRIGVDHNEISGQAKDLGSAAVLVSLLIFLCVWVPSIWNWWSINTHLGSIS